MSRPRKPFGNQQPGRLPATMLKVLAAEMSDQGRLARGRRYHQDEAIIDIVIGHGSVTAEVQGSRPEPYLVTIEVEGGTGIPRRSEIWASCTCPDDSGTGADLCKHAVAVMFSLSDEVSIDPDLLERWRSSRRRPASADVTHLDDHRSVAVRPEPTADDTPADHRAQVIPLHGRDRHDDRERETREVRDPRVDGLARLLAAPAGAAPPDFPDVEPIDHRSLPDAMLREVLEDALDHLELRWE
jgi:uncharacterized Zn finger protein